MCVMINVAIFPIRYINCFSLAMIIKSNTDISELEVLGK